MDNGRIEPPWPPGEPEPPIFTDEWWALFAERVKKGWWAPLVGLLLAVSGAFEALIGLVVAIIISMLSGTIGKAVMGGIALVGMSAFHTFTKRARPEAVKWATEAVDTFFVDTSEWAPFVTQLMNNLTGGKAPLDPDQFKSLPVGAGHAAGALAKTYLDQMLGLIMPGWGTSGFPMGLEPEDGLRGAERFLGVNLQFQMSAWLLHLLGDTFSFGMWKAMKDLPNALSWSFGIGWLSWLVMGTPFRMGIAEPLEVFFNRMYRPYKFSIARVADVYWRGLKDTGWFYSKMRDLGVTDPDMPIVMEMERAKMTSPEVYSLYRKGKVAFGQLVAHQRAQGHSPEESQLLATEMSRREVGDLVVDIAKTAMKHYKDRRMSVAELKGFLREALWTDEEANLIVQDLNMQMALEKPEEVAERVLTPANIARLFQLGEKTRGWAEMMLTKRGFVTEEISDFLLLYKPKVEKEPEPKEPPASLIGTLYKRGLMSKAEAKARWKDLDLTTDYIALLVMQYAPPEPVPPPPPREFSPSEIGRLYRDRYITRKIALERLTAAPINFEMDDAVMFLDAFYTPIVEVVPPPKEVPAAVVGGLYREGRVTEETLRTYLVELRYSDRAVEWMVESYAPPVPPPPVPPREFTPSELGRLWRDHYLTTEVTMTRLTGPQVRMTTEDARMYLDAFYQPVEVVEPPPREAPASVVGILYRQGMVALSDFEEYLDFLRYSQTSKEYLILEYQPPIPPPPPLPREFTPTEIGRLFTDISITPRDAVDRLTGPQVRMTTEDAVIYLRAFYIPTDILDIGTLYTIGTIDRVEAIGQLMTLLPRLLEVEAMYYLDTFF